MNLKTKTFLVLLAALVFCGLQMQAASAGGFGVSPSSISNANLIPGSSFEQDIALVQSTPDVDLNATVTVSVGQASSWISIGNGNSFVIPKGVQQFPMKVNVNVPLGAPAGEYKGIITINTVPVGQQKSGVSVVLGGDVNVDLVVSQNQVSNFTVQNFQIPDVAQGSPINFVMKVNNTGNTAGGPTSVDLTFFDQYHSKQLGEQTEAVTQKVQPFQTGTVSVQFPNSFSSGSYWADVKIYNNTNIVTNDKLTFNVTSSSAVQSQQKAVSAAPTVAQSTSSTTYLWILLILVVIIILIPIILVLRKKE